MRRQAGMMTLEVILSVILLAGLIIIMGRTLHTHKKQQQAANAGAQLAIAINAYFDQGVVVTGGQLPFIQNTTYCPSNSTGQLTTLADGYVDASNELGLNLCSAHITVS